MKFRLSQAAELDLDDIWFRIAVDTSEATASRITGGVLEACYRLEDFPLSGSPRPNIGVGVRAIVYKPYVAFDIVTESEVLVTRILHGSQDVLAISGLDRDT